MHGGASPVDALMLPTIVGWIVQWKFAPFTLSVRTGLDAPGAMSPESCDPSLKTMWWTTLSVLRHANVVPWATDDGLGAKDCAPLSPTMVMVAAAGGFGPAGLPLELPQPHAATAMSKAAGNEDRKCTLPGPRADDDRPVEQGRCHAERGRFTGECPARGYRSRNRLLDS